MGMLLRVSGPIYLVHLLAQIRSLTSALGSAIFEIMVSHEPSQN